MQNKPQGRDRRRENAAATQSALRAAGRRLFGRQGYEATSVGDLSAAAGVTTGALYHHYGDKKRLFAAVAEEMDQGLVRIAQAATAATLARGGDAWAGFLAGIDAVLDAGQDAERRRIGLHDAPAVLGPAGWTEIRMRNGLGAMLRVVQGLQAARVIAAGDPERVARLVLGLLYGAIEALPGNSSPADLAATRELVHRLLNGLRVG